MDQLLLILVHMPKVMEHWLRVFGLIQKDIAQKLNQMPHTLKAMKLR